MSATLDCKKLVDEYLAWLKSGISTKNVAGACEITAPFLDRHNDYVQFYIQRVNGRYRLSDDGQTIRDLEMSGVDLSTSKRSRFLEMILNGLGVQRNGDELVTEAADSELGLKQHALIQSILAVNDMFVTAKPFVASLFREDVESFLHSYHVRFISSVQFRGHSHFVHNFDFVVPASNKCPERIIKAINQPTRDQATSLLFAWSDTKQVRPEGSRAYAFLNDVEKNPASAVLEAFGEYDVTPVLWSEREKYSDELAA